MRPPAPLPPSLGTAFTRGQGRIAGMSDKQLRRADLLIPFRGIRMLPARDGREEDEDPDAFADPVADALRTLSAAYALALPAGVHFSHSTAAVHHGIPLPTRAFAQLMDPRIPLAERVLVEASTRRPGRAPRGHRVRGHQSLPALEPIMILRGMPVTTPTATWASLASRLSIEELVGIGDAIVRIPRIPGPFGRVTGAPMATLRDLDAIIAAGRRPGIRKLREARALIRIGSSSPKESELRLVLATGGRLPTPELDYDVYDSDGRFLGCSELAYPRFRVAVEYEGDYHRTERKRWLRDIDKYQAYAAAGWRVAQVTAAHLRTPHETIGRVRDVLRQAGWHPGA